MAESDDSQKTEDPTGRKLQDARDQGQVARSQEVNNLLMILALTLSVVMFGGSSPDGDLGDTWLWAGSDWSELSPATSPPPRESAGVTYDPVSGQLVLFGGQSFGKLSHETWTLPG